MALIRILGATRSFGAARAVDDVSISLAGGRVHALMGENGAGKSTLIRMIAGVLAPDRMAVEKAGQPQPLRSAQDAHAAGFRVIHQELDFVPQLSVAENILLGRPCPQRFGLLLDWRRMRAQAEAALALLGVDHIDVARQAGQLPTGDRMLMRIASALVRGEGEAEPCLYVLDEPTAALTGPEAERLFRVIGALKARGAALLYVSHRMQEILTISDDVTVLRDGRVVWSGPTRDTSQGALIAAMTGRAAPPQAPPARRAPGAGAVCAVQGLATARLSGLSFDLGPGEILGVAGLAEAGQSEVLRLFLGLERPRAGTCSLLGAPAPRAPAAAWARGVAYVPRERRAEGLMLRMGVRPNALLPHLADYGIFARSGLERVRTRALAAQVALRAQGTEQVVGQLSGGNQQKVVFARAIAGTPKLLLLDEPTRGVDVGAKYEIHALIRDLSAGGCGVILASSDLPELLGLADRILVLRQGRQAALLAAGAMTSAELLGHIYGDAPCA